MKAERRRRAREEAAAAVEDERRRREREEAAVAAAAMAAELMQTPPSQGPRPRRHFVEEAECSDLDSGSDDRSGSDVDGLIDDGPRVETPLGDRLRRHLDLERSGNPAARRRSRVGGWVSGPTTAPSSPGVSVKSSLLSPIKPMGRLPVVAPMDVSPMRTLSPVSRLPLKSSLLSPSKPMGRLSADAPMEVSPMRTLTPVSQVSPWSQLSLSSLPPLSSLPMSSLPSLDPALDASMDPHLDGGGPTALPAASQVRSQELLQDACHGAIERRWATVALRREALDRIEPIPKDRRADDVWIKDRLLHWEPHRDSHDGVLELHRECRRWTKATFLAKLRVAKLEVSARVAVPALRAMWLAHCTGGDASADAERLSQEVNAGRREGYAARDLDAVNAGKREQYAARDLDAVNAGRRERYAPADLRDLSPLARKMATDLQHAQRERLRQMQLARARAGLGDGGGDADADADGNLAGFVGAHPDDAGDEGEPASKAAYEAECEMHRHRLLEGALMRERRRPEGDVSPGLEAAAVFDGDLPVEYWSALDGEHGDVGRVACPHCGALHMPCGKSAKAMTWPCCLNGTLRELPRWEEPPAGDSASRYVWELWRDQSNTGRVYRQYSRAINNALALSHLTVGNQSKHADGKTKTGWNPTIIVNGRVATLMGTLLPAAGAVPKFAQLYTLGGGEEEVALDRRVGLVMQWFSKKMGKDARRSTEVTLRFLITELTARLRRDNPYVRDFVTAAESIRAAEERGESVRGVRVRVDAGRAPPGAAARTYIGDGRSEVYMVMPDDIGSGEFGGFELKLRPGLKEGNPLRQMEGNTMGGFYAMHRAADPTHFVLLFPDGRDGWHRSRTVPAQGSKRDPHKVTAREWYNYYSYERERHPLSPDGVAWDDTLHRAGRLFQEWLCAGWIKAEDDRLSFLASEAGQKKIRAENYADLADHMRSDDAGVEVGRVINPSTSRGSSRKLKKYFEDAMATVRHFGPPSLFITMTANGGALEVTLLLKEGQSAEDRWDLCSEVFDAHKKKLLHEIDAQGIFGTAVARFSVVEFQKRGLAHLHLLLWLIDPPTDGESIDAIVKAQIPPAGRLRDLILRTNVHACSESCIEGGRCSKFFPKPESDVTRLKDPNEIGDFVQYTRTSRAVTVEKTSKVTGVVTSKVVTDGDVVSFSPYLSLRHESHVNVEIVASSKSPKYLTKYLSKGGSIDRAMVAEDAQDNEIAQFRSRRVVGAHSGLLGLRMVPELELKPPTENLTLHMPGKKMVFQLKKPGGDVRSVAQAALDRAANRPSQLEAFFDINKTDATAFGKAIRTLPYELLPHYCTWKGASGLWMPRERRGQAAVGRLRWVHPKSGDVFYLRKLLMSLHGIGVTSFEELRTVDGVPYPTFKAACVALGMVEGSAEYSQCLAEAALTRMPYTLRRLFVSILVLGEVADARALLEAHWEAMSDDFRRRGVALSEGTRRVMLRAELDHLASQAVVELDVGDWGARGGVDDVDEGVVADAAVALTGGDLAAASAVLAGEARAERAPSKEQDAFITAVGFAADEGGGCFFLSAGAGTGKTFTLDLLINELRASGKTVAAMASSGIAAQLLPAPSGTIHSTLGVSIDVATMEVPRLDLDAARQKARREGVWNTDVFVVDEACMSHKAVFEALDNSLRSFARPRSDGGFGPEIDLTQPSHPSWEVFGGKTVVLAGHWAQTLPIVPRGGRAGTAHACAFNAPFWGHCQVWRLTENFRLRGADGAAQHAAFLDSVAEGLTSDAESGALGRLPDGGGVQALPAGIVQEERQSLADWVYGGAAEQVRAGDYASREYYEFWTSRAILAPHRKTVAAYNAEVLSSVFGKAEVYLSTDIIVDADEDGQDPGTGWGVELLNEAWPGGLPPHELPLMPGVPVMATQNLPHLGVFNGTRMIVLEVHRSRETSAPAFAVCGVWKAGQYREVLIPRAKTVASDDLPFVWMRQQFPLQLCFGMTINKAQGQTLRGRVGVVLTSPVWTHGMLYVALGRVTDPANLRVLTPPNPGGAVTNVVYVDVLEVGEAREAQCVGGGGGGAG